MSAAIYLVPETTTTSFVFTAAAAAVAAAAAAAAAAADAAAAATTAGTPVMIVPITVLWHEEPYHPPKTSTFPMTIIIQSKTSRISMVSGTYHSSLDRHFFQNDDKNDQTHRAQNVYLSRPT